MAVVVVVVVVVAVVACVAVVVMEVVVVHGGGGDGGLCQNTHTHLYVYLEYRVHLMVRAVDGARGLRVQIPPGEIECRDCPTKHGDLLSLLLSFAQNHLCVRVVCGCPPKLSPNMRFFCVSTQNLVCFLYRSDKVTLF